MIILRSNFLNTITQFTSSNGTVTASNLFDRTPSTQWASENAGTDATTASFRIVFTATQTVDKIVLLNINLSNFTVRPNTTTSAFTPAISETVNSATNLYYSVATTTLTELVVTMNSTFPANSEKKVGDLLLSNLLFDFSSDRLPSSAQYKPQIYKKQMVHEMSDGGMVVYNIRNKFRTEIGMDFASTSTVASLKTVYDLGDAFNFIPFETTGSWDGDIAECVWTGPFEFEEFTDNTRTNGFKGRIILRQTPGGAF